MKKRITIVAITLLAVLSMVALGGCSLFGPSAEDVIRKGIASDFDSVLDPSSETYQEIIDMFDESGELDELGVDPEEFMASLLGDFTYDITSVEVDEENDSAVAYVTISCKSLGDASTRIEELSTDWLEGLYSDPEAAASYTEDDLMKQYGELVMQALDETSVRSVDVELKCNRDSDGVWSEDDSVADEIERAMMS